MQAEQWEKGPFDDTLSVRVSDPLAAAARTKLFPTHVRPPSNSGL